MITAKQSQTPPPALEMTLQVRHNECRQECWEIEDENRVKRATAYSLEDARKFAAMPDLMDACRRLAEARDIDLLGEANWDQLFEAARAAIKKTKGEM